MIHFCCNFRQERKFLNKTYFLNFLKLNCKSWSVVFFGSDNYSMHSLKGLHKQMENNLIKRLEVVVKNAASPVYKFAVLKGIKAHIWPPNLNESFDFGVIASFGILIPKNVIDHFALGIFNVHASLLPKYRGGMPIVHALKNGESVTGVTISRIVHDKFDAGEIILQESCCIDENELLPSLHNKLGILGCRCLLKVIKTLPECLNSSFPQSIKDVSYAPILHKKAAVVKWYDMTALEIYNLYRALCGSFELMTTWKGKSVKLVCLGLNNYNFSVDSSVEKLEPGSLTYDKKSRFLYVQCKDKPIAICTILFKSKMHKAVDFYTGYLHNIPKTLWKFGS